MARKPSPGATDEILGEYDRLAPDLAELGRRGSGLIADLLRGAGIRVHSVTNRVKRRQSLERKLGRGEAKYAALANVTDVVGLRVITYFPDEVDAVAEVIEREFEIDPENSVDRRATLEPDRFGYLSLHYVAAIGPTRRELAEWAQYGAMRFEIQIRSILQHAWAEIEHDLGYKSPGSIPRPVRRRFSRLAGLLEIADEEFAKLRDDIRQYEAQVVADVARRPDTTGIDQESLLAFAKRSPLIKELDSAISGLIGSPLEKRHRKGYLSAQAARLQDLGLRSIGDVSKVLDARRDDILSFAARWIGPREAVEGKHGPVPRGVALFYANLLLAAEIGSVEATSAQLAAWGWSAEKALELASEAAKMVGPDGR